MTLLAIFGVATAACEFWHQVREPLLAFLQASGLQ